MGIEHSSNSRPGTTPLPRAASAHGCNEAPLDPGSVISFNRATGTREGNCIAAFSADDEFGAKWTHAEKRTQITLVDNIQLQRNFSVQRNWSAPSPAAELRNEDLLRLAIQDKLGTSSFERAQVDLLNDLFQGASSVGQLIVELLGKGRPQLAFEGRRTLFIKDGRSLVISPLSDANTSRLSFLDPSGAESSAILCPLAQDQETEQSFKTLLARLESRTEGSLAESLHRDCAAELMSCAVQISDHQFSCGSGRRIDTLRLWRDSASWSFSLTGHRNFAGEQPRTTVRGLSDAAAEKALELAETFCRVRPLSPEALLKGLKALRGTQSEVYFERVEVTPEAGGESPSRHWKLLRVPLNGLAWWHSARAFTS